MKKVFEMSLLKIEDLQIDKKINEIYCISNNSSMSCWRLVLSDGLQLFAKTCNAPDCQRLRFELEGLNKLILFAKKDYLIIPKPIGLEIVDDICVLLLPWLRLKSGNQRMLGEGLALLHKKSSEGKRKFGWNKDGFIGLGRQEGGYEKSWGYFFVKKRILPQLKLGIKWGINLEELEDFMNKLIKFLDLHEPKACLVHGDLWSGNAATNSSDQGIIYDPATSWSDREVDVAMSKMFGGFDKNFYDGYNYIWPLDKDFEKRIEIYNLYHLLNHANIFGGSYISQSLQSIRKISAELP